VAQLTRNSRCPCGSGKRYKACCSKKALLGDEYWLENTPGRYPFSLLDPRLSFLVENEPVCEFEGKKLPPGLFARQLGDDHPWKDFAAQLIDNRTARTAGVMTKTRERKLSEARVTSIVEQGELADAISDMVRTLYIKQIEPFYNAELIWYQQPQILRYEPGGYYRPHADSDEINPKTNKWERVNNRHLSLLVYLDEDYEGGELSFPNLDYKLRPKPGMLLAFPSDGRYLHGAMPVRSGIRHALVSWSSIVGGDTFRDKPPLDAVFMNR